MGVGADPGAGVVEQRGQDRDAEGAADLAAGLVEADRGREARRAGPTSAAAVETPVAIAPVPTPIRTPIGSQKARNAGCSGSATAHSSPAVPSTSAPPAITAHGPRRATTGPARSATAAAMIAPGVIESPASSGE